MSYQQEYARSIEDPQGFWKEKADAISWFKAPQTILSKDENGIDRWFADGELNTAYLALDYHVESGRGEQTALIYDSPVTGSKRKYSYNELLDEVSRTAGMLASQGVGRGDRVVIYMPMIPQAAMAMLACARLGAIHSVVFGGFAPNELAVRIDDAQPKVVLSASCGIEVNRIIDYKPMLDEALSIAKHKPVASIVFQREQSPAALDGSIDHDWMTLLASAEAVGCTPVLATDPLYVLYTSGTTGKPKGVVRDNGGHAVAMHYSMKAIYNMEAGDVFWAASDVGWVVGHSYIVYAPLIRGCTTVFYEGKPVFTPDAGAFWRVASEYKVRALFAAPTAFRAIKKEDPEGALVQQYDLSALDTIFMAGERLDPPTYEWTVEKTGKPVIDHWWQTETGWAIAGNLAGVELLPVKPGSATVPVPGFNVQILNESGEPAGANEQGFVAIKQPLPPSCLPTVWGDIDRFRSGYLEQFPGYYVSGDGGYLDEDGYLFIMGRVDDVINVAGHRLSTGEMEEVVAGHPAVAECAVIGINDSLKGQLPLGLILLKNGVDQDPAELEKELVQMVRKEIGPLACFQRALVVSRLPKTRSGKILRRSLRQIAAGEEYAIPSTIDDPASLPEIEALMAEAGVISVPA
ncbi:propionyl-CoA synthetase [Aestuariirhabdus litorea]|uniref:Propionyl-CoA synthetase n=1 Tax=Aestuariirhabdus litorea TaxID=2528527 RepID=A0A3P3VQT1_9GAMM|nr:propionyl-CoA synthetase [Aestuariirhabdus litorea]RRJ84814.1 propionyl-CoA synthetase [Aestuariirhabdus litorea]RWW98039.1 acetate--CoA ligase [Endozoicomonadaceae bacterium GTF-13]